ncbi:MAG: hypothetical protein WBM44_30160 [Waterburya sp.]
MSSAPENIQLLHQLSTHSFAFILSIVLSVGAVPIFPHLSPPPVWANTLDAVRITESIL